MKKQFILQFYKKCFFILSIIMLFTHIHASKSQHPSMQLSKNQERILTVESEKNLFLSLRYYNKNDQLGDFIKEELRGTKNPEEEKGKLKKTTLELIQIYAKFGNIDDNRSTIMIEQCIGFTFYELYKRQPKEKQLSIEKKIKKSTENLFGFRPFNNLINEYEKILKNSGARNVNNRVLHVKKVILLTLNNLYEESKSSNNFITKQDPEPNNAKTINNEIVEDPHLTEDLNQTNKQNEINNEIQISKQKKTNQQPEDESVYTSQLASSNKNIMSYIKKNKYLEKRFAQDETFKSLVDDYQNYLNMPNFAVPKNESLWNPLIISVTAFFIHSKNKKEDPEEDLLDKFWNLATEQFQLLEALYAPTYNNLEPKNIFNIFREKILMFSVGSEQLFSFMKQNPLTVDNELFYISVLKSMLIDEALYIRYEDTKGGRIDISPIPFIMPMYKIVYPSYYNEIINLGRKLCDFFSEKNNIADKNEVVRQYPFDELFQAFRIAAQHKNLTDDIISNRINNFKKLFSESDFQHKISRLKQKIHQYRKAIFASILGLGIFGYYYKNTKKQ